MESGGLKPSFSPLVVAGDCSNLISSEIKIFLIVSPRNEGKCETKTSEPAGWSTVISTYMFNFLIGEDIALMGLMQAVYVKPTNHPALFLFNFCKLPLISYISKVMSRLFFWSSYPEIYPSRNRDTSFIFKTKLETNKLRYPPIWTI